MQIDKNETHEHTKGMKLLFGDHKKAIISLSVPIMVSLCVSSIYQLTDAFWVSGMGPEALSAVGLFFPINLLITAIGNGLGIGGGAFISQCLGAKNKAAADNTSIHQLLIMLCLAVVLSLTLFFGIDFIYTIMNAEQIKGLALSYAKIIIPGIVFLFFQFIAAAILRSEGNVNKVMIALVVSAIINIILDPVFIYTLKLGVAGAAIATVVSIFISCLFFVYWLFIKRNTYLTVKMSNFKYDSSIIKKISGLSSQMSLTEIFMAVLIFVNINIIVIINGTNGVAVYTAGLRYIIFTFIPIMSVSAATISLIGVAYGAKDFEKLKNIYNHGIKVGLIIEGIIMVLTILFAPAISKLFTWSGKSSNLFNDFIIFFQIIVLICPAMVFALISSSTFAGCGKGTSALLINFCRTLFFTIPSVLLFTFVFKFNLLGVWLGIVAGNYLTAIMGVIWSRLFINKTIHETTTGSETGK